MSSQSEPKTKRTKVDKAEEKITKVSKSEKVDEHKEEASSAEEVDKSSSFVGSAAPNFTVPNQDGDDVSLSSFAGSYVCLFFYPRANTPGCTAESCRFSALAEDFAALNCKIIGVSADSTKSQTTFKTKNSLAFDLLADQKRQVIKPFKAASGDKVKRSTVLISPDGKVIEHWATVSGAAKHPDQVLARLKQLQA